MEIAEIKYDIGVVSGNCKCVNCGEEFGEYSFAEDCWECECEGGAEKEMDIHTVKEIIKLCIVLHDSPDSGIEEASGIDLVRMQLEDVLQTLKEKKK